MVKKYLLFLVFGIFLINFVFASFTVGDLSNSLKSNYELGENLTGWINLSFDNESINGVFEDSFGNSFVLDDLLNANLNYNSTINSTTNEVTSSFGQLYVDDLNLQTPNISGDLDYELNFSNTIILSMTVNIQPKSNFTLKTNVRNLLDEKKSFLNNLDSEILQFDLFVQKSLNETFDSDGLSLQLSNLENLYDSANGSTDYDSILFDLQSLKIPEVLSVGISVDELKFYPDERNINLDAISQIVGGTYANEENFVGALVLWNDELNNKVTYRAISAIYGDDEEFVLGYFKMDFQDGLNGDYFIVEQIDDLTFRENYGLQVSGRYSYVPLGSISTIEFTTTEDIGFLDVPIVISPSLDELPVTDVGDYVDSQKEIKISKWLLFTLVIVFLLILFFVVYSILHAWYDKRYENYLFPNRNNLYNLIIYINSAKKRGSTDSEIEKTLKKSKWTSEQVRYVTRKYSGKRTGMVMLPFMKKKLSGISKNKSPPPYKKPRR